MSSFARCTRIDGVLMFPLGMTVIPPFAAALPIDPSMLDNPWQSVSDHCDGQLELTACKHRKRGLESVE